MREKIKANYHWVIAAVSLLTLTIVGGIGNALYGIILIPITESFGISRGDYSIITLLRNLASFALNLFSGLLLIKFGYRKLVSAALIVSSIGFCLAAVSQNLTVFSVASVLQGMYTICTIAGCTRLLGSWFHRHYGLVMGIVTSSTGLGGALFSILLSDVTVDSGWRNTHFATALFFLVVIVLTVLLVRDTPESMSLKPYGEGENRNYNNKRESKDHWPGFFMTELRKKPVFYLLVFGTLLSSGCCYMANSVLVAHVQDCGMDAELAARVQSIMLLVLAAAKLLFGFLSDKIGAKTVTMISLIACTISFVLLAEISGPASTYVAAVVYSISLLLTAFIPQILVPSLLGYRSGAEAMGIVVSMISAANMIATPLTNFLRDMLGSYRPVFRATALVSVGIIALYVVIYALSAKDRKKQEAE